MNSADAFRRLQQLGAGRFAHMNGSLALHLRGTETLLRDWANREALCLAGLYHAVYGTGGIEGSLVDLDGRGAIAEVIGVEAETLAYLYGACDRETFHPRIGTRDQLLFADRFTHSEYAISESQLRDVCELTVANEVDLALGSEAFRVRHRAELVPFFDRMRGLISESGLATYQRVLRNPTKSPREAGFFAVGEN